MQITRSVWNALPTLIKLPTTPVPAEAIDPEVDIPSILFPHLEVEAGCETFNSLEFQACS